MRAPCDLPRIFLGATKRIGEREVPITEIELENGVSAGISLRKLGIDLVPIYEEHTARLERGISVKDWLDMSETEKALILARRRISIQMNNLQTEAEIKQAKRDANKRK